MIKIIILSVFVSVSLFARVDPFEADASMMKNKLDMDLKPIKIKEALNNKDDGKRSVKIAYSEPVVETIVNVEEKIVKTVSKPKVVLVKKTNNAIIGGDKKVIAKVMPEKSIAKKEKIIKRIKVIKKAVKIKSTNSKALAFVKIEDKLNYIRITSRKKYHVITSHVLSDENKIAFDFLAKTNFYSRFKKLKSPNFKSYSIGNHKNKYFFRVTIALEHPYRDYNIIINGNIASVKYIK